MLKLKNLIIVLLVTAIASSGLCFASENSKPSNDKKTIPFIVNTTDDVTCDDALNACDDALKKADLTILAYKGIIESQSDMLAKQQKEIETVRKQRDSIWRNPVLYFSLGLVTAGLTGILIHEAIRK